MSASDLDYLSTSNDSTAISWIINYVSSKSHQPVDSIGPWIYALVCSSLVGLSGLFPLFLLSLGKTSDGLLRFMLSFAVGGLLGDVFLHLLPEAYERLRKTSADPHEGHLTLGLWILMGILTFIVVEMLMGHSERAAEEEKDKERIKISGYLNLIANCIDNFAHGLAVGGAFLVDAKTGVVTTTCILCHEIPHEIGDFAILMDSGFSKGDAARAQLSTASVGVMGAMAALALNSFATIDAVTAWIVPFTSGGFLHISLVTVLPDLMRSDSLADAIMVLAGIGLGISAMVMVSQL